MFAAALLLALAPECGAVDERAALALHENVFIAVVESHAVEPSGLVALELAHGAVVQGEIPPRVSLDPREVEITANRWHLFFTTNDGVVGKCPGARAMSSTAVAAAWHRLQLVRGGKKPPAALRLPLAAVADNFCQGSRKVVTLFHDGTVVVEHGGMRQMKRARSKQVDEVRRLSAHASADRTAGWLSYVPPGLQEVTLYVDDGHTWSGGPTYSQCGELADDARNYVTPHRARIVEAVLRAAGDAKGLEDCGCVK